MEFYLPWSSTLDKPAHQDVPLHLFQTDIVFHYLLCFICEFLSFLCLADAAIWNANIIFYHLQLFSYLVTFQNLLRFNCVTV